MQSGTIQVTTTTLPRRHNQHSVLQGGCIACQALERFRQTIPAAPFSSQGSSQGLCTQARPSSPCASAHTASVRASRTPRDARAVLMVVKSLYSMLAPKTRGVSHSWCQRVSVRRVKCSEAHRPNAMYIDVIILEQSTCFGAAIHLNCCSDPTATQSGYFVRPSWLPWGIRSELRGFASLNDLYVKLSLHVRGEARA
jgi:hypothetical protein